MPIQPHLPQVNLNIYIYIPSIMMYLKLDNPTNTMWMTIDWTANQLASPMKSPSEKDRCKQLDARKRSVWEFQELYHCTNFPGIYETEI